MADYDTKNDPSQRAFRDEVERLVNAPPRAAEPVGQPSRSFWIVEQWKDGRSTGYWDGGSSRSFVTDIDKAVHFCRHEDAFWVTRGWHWNDTKVCEHLYLEAASIQQTEPVAWLYTRRGMKSFATTERWAHEGTPWTETPLYASPSAQPIARDTVRLDWIEQQVQRQLSEGRLHEVLCDCHGGTLRDLIDAALKSAEGEK